MTFRTDYLPFGLVLRPMLQEPDDSEGPRVPSSIHSTPADYKNQDTTLMRMSHHHGSQEFSDLGCRISDLGSRVSDDGLPRSIDLRLTVLSVNLSSSQDCMGQEPRFSSSCRIMRPRLRGPSTRGQVYHGHATPGTPLPCHPCAVRPWHDWLCRTERKSAMGSKWTSIQARLEPY